MEGFRNTITRKEGGDFRSPGCGSHIMGLVGLKNIEITWKEEKKAGIQLMFKAAVDPDAIVCHRVASTLNPKSNLFKTLKRMSKGAAKESITAEEAFELLTSFLNKWWEVEVIEREGKDGRIFANVDDNQIRPARPEDCPKEAPVPYFEKAPKKPASKAAFDADNIPF